MNNRFQIMADIVTNKSQMKEAAASINKELEQATTATHDTSTRQAQAEIAQLQRLLTTVKNNENAGPGRYKTVDAKGQAAIDSLEEKLRDISRMSQGEIESTAREVEGRTKELGAKAARDIAGQIRTAGDAIIEVKRVEVSSLAINRAREKVETSLGDVTVRAKIVVDDSELRKAQRLVDRVQTEAGKATKRTQTGVERRLKAKKDEEREVKQLRIARQLELRESEAQITGKVYDGSQLQRQAIIDLRREDRTGKPTFNPDQRQVLMSHVATRYANHNTVEKRREDIKELEGLLKNTPENEPDNRRYIADRIKTHEEEIARVKNLNYKDINAAYARDYAGATEGTYRRPGTGNVIAWPKQLQLRSIRAANRTANSGERGEEGPATTRDRNWAEAARYQSLFYGQRAKRITDEQERRRLATRQYAWRLHNEEEDERRFLADQAKKNSLPGEYDMGHFPEGHSMSPATYGLDYDPKHPNETRLSPDGRRRALQRGATAFYNNAPQITKLPQSDNAPKGLYFRQPTNLLKTLDTYSNPEDILRVAAGLQPKDETLQKKFTSTQLMSLLGMPESYDGRDGARSADYTVRAGTDLHQAIQDNIGIFQQSPPQQNEKGDWVMSTVHQKDKKGKVTTKNHQLATALNQIIGKYGVAEALSMLYDRTDTEGNVRPGGLETSALFPNVSSGQLSRLKTDFSLDRDQEGLRKIEAADAVRYMTRTDDFDDENYIGSRKEHEKDQKVYQAQQQFIQRASRMRDGYRVEYQRGQKTPEELQKRITTGLNRGLSEMKPEDSEELLKATYTPEQAESVRKDLLRAEFEKLGVRDWADIKKNNIRLPKASKQRLDDLRDLKQYSTAKNPAFADLNEGGRRILASHLAQSTAGQIVGEQPTLLDPYTTTEIAKPKVFSNTPAAFRNPVVAITRAVADLEERRAELKAQGLKKEAIDAQMEAYIGEVQERYKEQYNAPTQIRMPSAGIVDFETAGTDGEGQLIEDGRIDNGLKAVDFESYANPARELAEHRLAIGRLTGIDTATGQGGSADVIAKSLSDYEADKIYNELRTGKRTLPGLAAEGIRPTDLDSYGHENPKLREAVARRLDADLANSAVVENMENSQNALDRRKVTGSFEDGVPGLRGDFGGKAEGGDIEERLFNGRGRDETPKIGPRYVTRPMAPSDEGREDLRTVREVGGDGKVSYKVIVEDEAYDIAQRVKETSAARNGQPFPKTDEQIADKRLTLGNDIQEFHGENAFLSNMYPAQVEYQGKIYPSVEHAFQAAKTDDPKEREKFLDPALTPYDAKKFGKEVTLRDNWDNERDGVMRQLLASKFSNPELRQRLAATTGRKLVEGNTWGDTYWGYDLNLNEGQNELGHALMRTRADINGESEKQTEADIKEQKRLEKNRKARERRAAKKAQAELTAQYDPSYDPEPIPNYPRGQTKRVRMGKTAPQRLIPYDTSYDPESIPEYAQKTAQEEEPRTPKYKRLDDETKKQYLQTKLYRAIENGTAQITYTDKVLRAKARRGRVGKKAPQRLDIPYDADLEMQNQERYTGPKVPDYDPAIQDRNQRRIVYDPSYDPAPIPDYKRGSTRRGRIGKTAPQRLIPDYDSSYDVPMPPPKDLFNPDQLKEADRERKYRKIDPHFRQILTSRYGPQPKYVPAYDPENELVANKPFVYDTSYDVQAAPEVRNPIYKKMDEEAKKLYREGRIGRALVSGRADITHTMGAETIKQLSEAYTPELPPKKAGYRKLTNEQRGTYALTQLIKRWDDDSTTVTFNDEKKDLFNPELLKEADRARKYSKVDPRFRNFITERYDPKNGVLGKMLKEKYGPESKVTTPPSTPPEPVDKPVVYDTSYDVQAPPKVDLLDEKRLASEKRKRDWKRRRSTNILIPSTPGLLTGAGIDIKTESMNDLVDGVKKLNLDLGSDMAETVQKKLDMTVKEMIESVYPKAMPNKPTQTPTTTMRNMDILTGHLAGKANEIRKITGWSPKTSVTSSASGVPYTPKGKFFTPSNFLHPSVMTNKGLMAPWIAPQGPTTPIPTPPATSTAAGVGGNNKVPNFNTKTSAGPASVAMGDLYTPVAPLVTDNAWIDQDQFQNTKTTQDVERERIKAINKSENMFAQRVKNVGDDVAETLSKTDYYGARSRGETTSARSFKQVEAENAARIREEAGKRVATLMGVTEEGFRARNSRGVSRETAFNAVLGGKIDRTVMDDDNILKTAAKYADQIVNSTTDAGSLISQAQSEIRAMRITRDESRKDLTGFARDDVIRTKVKNGEQLSTQEQQRYDGMTRTNNLRNEAEALAGRFGMDYAGFTDSSKGASIMSLAQQATGLSNNKMFGLDVDALSGIVGPINAAAAAMEAFGADSIEFKEAMDKAREAGQDAVENDRSFTGNHTQANDNQRRYKREISKIVNAANFNVGDDFQGQRITQTDIERSRKFQEDARRLVGREYVNEHGQRAIHDDTSARTAARANLADQIASSNERKQMVKAGLVNMGAFLGGSMLEQAISQVGTMVKDTTDAKKMLQRAVDVQGMTMGTGSAKPGWWPGLTGQPDDTKTDIGWDMVKQYSTKLGGTRTEAATLLTTLADGGANSLDKVNGAMQDMARVAQNTGMVLKDMVTVLQSLDQINIDGIEGAKLLGDYAGQKDLNLENIGAAATMVAATPSAMLYDQKQREQLVVGLAQDTGKFKGFSSNAYVASQQIDKYMEKGAATKKAPEFKTDKGPGAWIKSLTDVNGLMGKLTNLVDEAFEALKPVLAVFAALVTVLVEVTTAALSGFNAMGSFADIVGLIAGVTAAVWGLNAALAAMGAGGIKAGAASMFGVFAKAGTEVAKLGAVFTAIKVAMTGASGAGAAFGTVVTAGVTAARTALAGLAISLGPIGIALAAIGAVAAIGTGFYLKNKAAKNKVTKENTEKAEKEKTAYELIEDVRDSKLLDRYDPRSGPRIKITPQLENDQNFMESFARGLAGDPMYAIDALGLTVDDAETALKTLADSSDESMQRVAVGVRKAQAEIAGFQLAMTAATMAGERAYNDTKYTETQKVSAADFTSALLGTPTKNFQTDEDIEVTAAIAKRDAYNKTIKDQLRNQRDEQGNVRNLTIADLPMEERTRISTEQQTNEELVVTAMQKAVQVRGQMLVAQAKLNDDKLLELRATEQATENEKKQTDAIIETQLALAATGEVHANISNLQIRSNELALKQKQTQEQILQTIQDQAFATQAYLDLQNQLGDRAGNQQLGSGVDLAGEISGTAVGLQTGSGAIKSYYDNLINTLNNKPQMNADDKKLMEGLTRIAPQIAAADSVDRTWNQELESAARKQQTNPVSDADFAKIVEGINARGQAQMREAMSNLKTASDQYGVTGQQVKSASGVNVSGAWNQSQGYGATDFAQKQKGQEKWRNTAYYNGIHDGRDYAMPIGTKLKAPVGGLLEYTGDTGDGFGSKTRLKLDDGRTLMYGHQDRDGLAALMKQLGIKPGGTMRINAGDLMGISGDSGNGGKHVHAGLYDANGNTMDPASILKGMAGSNSTISMNALAPLLDPRMLTARGVQPTSNAREAAAQSAQYMQESINGVNSADKELADAISASADGVGAANTYQQKLGIFNNTFSRRLTNMQTQYNDAAALLDTKIKNEKDPDRKAILENDKRELTARYRTQRQETITSGRGQAANLFVDGAISEADRVSKVNGKVTPEVLRKQIAILEKAAESARTTIDPRFGLTIKDGERAEYSRLMGDLQDRKDQLANKKKIKQRTDYDRNLRSMYGTVTGSMLGLENQADRTRDQIFDDENYTEEEKRALGVDTKGNIIRGSQLDKIRNISNRQNAIKSRVSNYDTSVQLDQLNAGRDLYKIDRKGNLARAQANYATESNAFDKLRGQFANNTDFQNAKNFNLQDLRKRLLDAQKAVDDWSKNISRIGRDIADVRVGLGLGNQGTKARGIQDKIDTLIDSGQVSKDSEQIRTLQGYKEIAKKLDAGTVVTENFKDAYAAEMFENRDSLYDVDREGMKKRAENELKWAENTFDTKIGKNVTNPAERAALRVDFLKDFVANLKTATDELDGYVKYVRDIKLSVDKQGEDLGFAIAGGSRAKGVQDQITQLKADKKLRDNNPIWNQLNEQLQVARMFDAFEGSAKTFQRERETEAGINAESVQNIDYAGNLESARNKYDYDLGKAMTATINGKPLSKDQIAMLTAGSRNNYLQVQTAFNQEDDFKRARSKSVTDMDQSLGLVEEQGNRTKTVTDYIENLEKNQRNRQGDSEYTTLRDQANLQLDRAQKMDNADDALRLSRQDSARYEINDASKAFYTNSDAAKTFATRMAEAGNVSKATKDQINEMNLALEKQAQTITDTGKRMVNDYAASLRDVAVMSEKLSVNLGGYDSKSIGYAADVRSQIRVGQNKIRGLDDNKDQDRTEFMRQAFDANAYINLLGADGEKYKKFVSNVEGVGVIRDENQSKNLRNEVFNRRFNTQRDQAGLELDTTYSSTAEGIIDRLGAATQDVRFRDLNASLMNPDETRSAATILEEQIGDLTNTLSLGKELGNANNPAFQSVYNGQRGKDAQALANKRLADLTRLRDNPEATLALDSIRTDNQNIKLKETEMANVVGTDNAADLQRAAIQGEIDALRARVSNFVGIIQTILPEADLADLQRAVPDASYLVRLKERALDRQTAQRDSLFAESEAAFNSTSKRTYSRTATDKFYADSVANKRAEITEIAGRDKTLALETLRGTFGKPDSSVEDLQNIANNMTDPKKQKSLNDALARYRNMRDPSSLIGKSTSELYAMTDVNPDTIKNIVALNAAITALGDEAGDARAALAEGAYDMATNLRDSVQESSSVRMERALNSRDYAGAGRNAALTVADMQNKLIASVNARDQKNFTRADIGTVMKEYATDRIYSGDVANINQTARDLSQQIRTAAFNDSYTDSIRDFDRDAERARPKLSERSADQFDLRMLQQKLAFQQSVDTTQLDPSAQKSVLDDIRNTTRDIEQITNKMQNRWRDFWMSLGQDMVNTLRTGFTDMIKQSLDAIFQMETERDKKYRVDMSNSEIRAGAAGEEVNQAKADESYARQMRDAATNREDREFWNQMMIAAAQRGTDAKQAQRAEGTNQLQITNEKTLSDESEKLSVWSTAVEGMKNSFIEKISGQMFDEYIGTAIQSMFDKISGVQDPQIVATQALTTANVDLASTITSLPGTLQTAFEVITSAQNQAAQNMLTASQNMMSAAASIGMGGAIGVSGTNGVTDIAEGVVKAFGVTYGGGKGLGTTPTKPYSELPTPAGTSETAGNFGVGNPYASEFKPLAIAAPNAVPTEKPDDRLLKNGTASNLAAGAVSMAGNAINIPSVGDELTDYGVGFLKNTIVSGTASWVAAGAAGGIAGLGTTIGAALTNPVTAAVAVVGAGIMLLNNYTQNQKRAQEYRDTHQYTNSANSVYGWGVNDPKRGRQWMAVDGYNGTSGASKPATVGQVNVTVSDPLTSVRSQMEIGRQIGQQTSLAMMRKGVNI